MKRVASVAFSENDFFTVSRCAMDLWENDDRKDAERLDELARRMNRALTIANECKLGPRNCRTPLEIESPLESAGYRPAPSRRAGKRGPRGEK